MGTRQKKSPSKKSKKDAAEKSSKERASKEKKEKKEKRDPDEVRAETFRIAAQRETVEAFVVAFILALLFRAFLAEAFVIPTGSMAPTLMGAHKDLVCDQCETSFQVGASRERAGPDTDQVVVAGVCPNCRFVNPLDLAGDSNEATFNGDRILVSKFTYTINEPERWDVIVFKYPGNPKQNYIKRLVGLPNETLEIRHGDVYARPTGTTERTEILRKSPGKLLAMRQPVYDTDHQAQILIDANYPSRWQPWMIGMTEPLTDSWKVQRSSDGLVATLKDGGSKRLHWLRYFHRWPTDDQWQKAMGGGSLADVDPFSSRAITDFYAYGSYAWVYADEIYTERPSQGRGSFLGRMMNGGYSKGTFKADYQSGTNPEQAGLHPHWGGQDSAMQGLGRDGMNWVGDLMLAVELETSTESKELMLELVEAGVKYRCRIDLSSGQATLLIDDNEPRTFDPDTDGNTGTPTAQTSIRGGGQHDIRFSNCDNQLLLWIDGDVVSFDHPTTFDARLFRSDAEDYPRYFPANPLDGAPAAVGVRGGDATIRSLRIHRDKYYIATANSSFGILDYDKTQLFHLGGDTPSTALGIQGILEHPDRWSTFRGWDTRRTVDFELQADQFFPMGDNSPESLDARCWAGTKTQHNLPRGVNVDAWFWSDDSFVPRDLLVGKALLVFWPHSWNSPVPFTPNAKRMKFIR